MRWDYKEYLVPEWAVPYFVNDDPGDLSEEDIELAESFYERVYESHEEGWHFGHFAFEDEDPDMGRQFSWNPAFGLAGMCVPVKAMYFMDEQTEFVHNLEGKQ